MSDLELDIKGLSVSYGRVRALENVDLHVRPGEIVSLLGSNGAGKSTLLNAVACILPKRDGIVLYRGTDVSQSTPWRLVADGLVQVPEGRQVFPSLTVDEHLQLAEVYQERDGRRFTPERVYEIFPRLRERQGVMAGNLSGGEQQMLVVGRALVTQPRLLLLDEPSLGLSPKLAQTVINAVASLRDTGLSVLLVEQNAALALGVADRAYVLAAGRITAEGTAAEMRSSDEVRKAYLGDHA
jgi:branched-chain amino acid transport system ATP-binding protein